MTTEEITPRMKFYAEIKERIYRIVTNCKELNTTEKIGVLEAVKLTIHSLAHEHAITVTEPEEKPSE